MKKLLLLLLLFPLCGNAQSAQRYYTALLPNTQADEYVAVIPNASVYICQYNPQIQCLTPQPVYSDTGLTQPLPYPFLADGSGVYSYYAQSGTQVVEKVCAPFNQCSSYIVQVGDNIESLPGTGTVTTVSCGNLNPIFGCSVTNPTSTPALGFTLDNAANLTFLGNIQGSTGPPSYVTFAAGANITLTRSTLSNTLTISATGGGGGGGCTGTITGDNTSTDCGYQNRVGDTTTPPASVSTFGAQQLASNAANNVVSIGNLNGSGLTGNDITLIGDTNALNLHFRNFASYETAVVIGSTNVNGTSGSPCSAEESLVAIGGDNDLPCQGGDIFNAYMIGEANFSEFDGTTPNTASLQDVVAMGWENGWQGQLNSGPRILGDWDEAVLIGSKAGAEINSGEDVVAIGDFPLCCTPGNVSSVTISDIVAIGDLPASGIVNGESVDVLIGVEDGGALMALSSHSPGIEQIGIGDANIQNSFGTDVIGIGDDSIGSLQNASPTVDYFNTGHDVIGIGNHAGQANSTGSDNIYLGDYAGCNDCGSVTIGNANTTGSHNVNIGDTAGPSVTAQLSNTVAIGWNASTNASNQVVLGNSSITSLLLYGCPSGQVVYDDGTGTCFTPSAGGGTAPLVASAEVVTFSSTPTFSTSVNMSRIVLTGNITSFTLGAGTDGQSKTLCFEQGAGPYSVSPPSNMHGFFTIGTVNALWNCQSYNYDGTDLIWLATSLGTTNE